jgi:hypothetical protein
MVKKTVAFFLIYGALSAGFGVITQHWPPGLRLLATGVFAALAGLVLFWTVGLSATSDPRPQLSYVELWLK